MISEPLLFSLYNDSKFSLVLFSPPVRSAAQLPLCPRFHPAELEPQEADLPASGPYRCIFRLPLILLSPPPTPNVIPRPPFKALEISDDGCLWFSIPIALLPPSSAFGVALFDLLGHDIFNVDGYCLFLLFLQRSIPLPLSVALPATCFPSRLIQQPLPRALLLC
ncbi:hypothetical protein GW17_00048848 [Ensete ventricosum]|nr:hypothetical protein GW17_00048848 [Ensete ventricosum]